MNDSDLMCQCPVCGKSDKHFTIISPPMGRPVWTSVGGVVMAKCPCGALLIRNYCNGVVLSMTAWKTIYKTCEFCKSKESFFAKYCTQCGTKFNSSCLDLNPTMMPMDL